MNKASLSLVGLLALASCGESTTNSSTEVAKGARADSSSTPTLRNASTDAAFISVDSANRMLGSYINSVGEPANDTNLRSLILDASALRSYLTDGRGADIKTMKVMFAHTPEYMNAGGTNRNCGYRSGALTIIVAGIDADGNYVMYDDNEVMNHAIPCPSSCPSAGTASSDLLPQ